MLKQLMPCVLAADCWTARMACPREGFGGKTWARYFGTRMEAVKQALAEALARLTVLERIPIRWIPPAQVRAELRAAMAKAGFDAEVVEMQLIPPVTGGREWVERECGEAIALLVARARSAPVAAMLHWPDRTAAAIVVSVGGQLKAFGPAFGADGVVLDFNELSGATVVQAMKPPVSFLQRCARRFGLHWLIWRWIRHRRLRLGANPLAAI
jgi:hypothetical protein